MATATAATAVLMARQILVLLLLIPCCYAAAVQQIPTVPLALLQHAADPGTYMPMAGLGMGNIGTYGHNAYAAVNATASMLAIGGRRTDAADSYGCEPGIGLAMRRAGLCQGSERSSIFIGSKIGPGGLSFPLGHDEAINQVKGIVANYSCGGHVDLVLIHWPFNYGPCSYHGPKPSIPTTDPLCDTAKPQYSESGCRISTWKGLVAMWKAGLTRAVGVSNFNSTHMQELKDAGLPLPAVNQVSWFPGIYNMTGGGDSPTTNTETKGELLAWCKKHGVLLNGYSPFLGPGGAGKLFADPKIKAIAEAHNSTSAQVVLNWHYQLGVATNPMAQDPTYQRADLDYFSFNLTDSEVQVLNYFKPTL